jgi:thiol-disulfide isomerase/thioredoxin
VDFKFKAVNGREVDLANYRGKVVLVDFWATWCGPCMVEVPHVVETYHKLHSKGFEIVGISFDQDKAALARVTAQKGMLWPQYFDGKGWQNDFGVKYGIHSIPTMWLIDKQGRIASTDARPDLAGQVERLLNAPAIASVLKQSPVSPPAQTTPTAPSASPPAPPAPITEAKGAPLDMKFTAVDGREIDLAQLHGKVVLIDFWATWCAPCMVEAPRVVEAYKRLHPRGFEIVGISFDQDKAALERITKEKGMIWPQYFDGKGWQNDFGVKYGIHSIPTMWLIDKHGKIASTNAREDLAGQIEKLLAGSSL